MRWSFFHSIVHGWSWEKLDDDSNVIAECRTAFDTREEAEQDAVGHGYVPGASELVSDAALPHVVVVQREEGDGHALARLLPHVRVTLAKDGQDALQLARESPVDGYVVDLAPHGGGLRRFCAALRASDPRVPIVVYGDGAGARGAEALMAGASLALSRPHDAGRLRHTIDAMLQVARSRSREARHAELLAVQEQLLERISELQREVQSDIAHRKERMAWMRTFIEDDATRLMACKAFLGRGGTRAEFERAFPQVVAEAGARCLGSQSDAS